MSKNRIMIVIVILLICTQTLSLFLIFSLYGKVQDTKAALQSELNALSNTVDGIYTDVDDMITATSSLFSHADIEVGDLDTHSLAVPLTFTLIPREPASIKSVGLSFSGEAHEMKKQGDGYTLTIPCYIFSEEPYPIIIINKADETIVTENNAHLSYEKLAFAFFPQMTLDWQYDVKTSAEGHAISAELSVIDSLPSSDGIEYVSAALAVKVDGSVMAEELIALSELDGMEFERTLPLREDAVFTIALILTDNLGLRHHLNLDSFTISTDGAFTPISQSDWQIYSADDEFRWQSE